MKIYYIFYIQFLFFFRLTIKLYELISFYLYTLTNDDELKVRYEAETDKITIVNLTQHSYFNLSANLSRDILAHQITIDADSFLPVDKTLIPSGELRDVEGTPFDFREPKRVGDDINEDYTQLTLGNGYDHCWVLNNQNEVIPRDLIGSLNLDALDNYFIKPKANISGTLLFNIKAISIPPGKGAQAESEVLNCSININPIADIPSLNVLKPISDKLEINSLLAHCFPSSTSLAP